MRCTMLYTNHNFSYDIQATDGLVKGTAIGAGIGTVAAVIKAVKQGKMSLKQAIKLVGIGALAGAGLGVGSRVAGEHHRHAKLRKLGYEVDHHGNAVFKDKKGKPHLVALQRDLPKSGSPASYLDLARDGKKIQKINKHGKPVGKPENVNSFKNRMILYKLAKIDLPKKLDKNGTVIMTPKQLKYDKETMEYVVGHELGHKLEDPNVRKHNKGKMSDYEMAHMSDKQRRKGEIAADRYALKRGANPAHMHKWLRDYSRWLYKKQIPQTRLMKKEKLDELIKKGEYIYRGNYLEKKAAKWNKRHPEG